MVSFRSSSFVSADGRAFVAVSDQSHWVTGTLDYDAGGNVVVGEVHSVDARGNIVFSEEGPVVLFGVNELVVDLRGTPHLEAIELLAQEVFPSIRV